MNSLEVLKVALTNYPELFNYDWSDCKKFRHKWFKSIVNKSLLENILCDGIEDDMQFTEDESVYLAGVFEDIITKEGWFKRFFNKIVIHEDFCHDVNACIIIGTNIHERFVLQYLNHNELVNVSVIGDKFKEFDYKTYQQDRFESSIKKAENSIKYYQDELNKLKEN